jgi:hypothetical protein
MEMEKYMAEEQAAESAAIAMRERIDARKRELAEKKSREVLEDVTVSILTVRRKKRWPSTQLRKNRQARRPSKCENASKHARES